MESSQYAEALKNLGQAAQDCAQEFKAAQEGFLKVSKKLKELELGLGALLPEREWLQAPEVWPEGTSDLPWE